MYYNPITSHLNREDESFSSKIWNNTRMSIITILIQHSDGSFSQSNYARERNKKYTNNKGENQIILLFLYTKKKSKLKTPQKVIGTDKFSRGKGYKVSIYKSIAFLYTNNLINEKEIMKSSSSAIATKIKYIRIH